MPVCVCYVKSKALMPNDIMDNIFKQENRFSIIVTKNTKNKAINDCYHLLLKARVSVKEVTSSYFIAPSIVVDIQI